MFKKKVVTLTSNPKEENNCNRGLIGRSFSQTRHGITKFNYQERLKEKGELDLNLTEVGVKLCEYKADYFKKFYKENLSKVKLITTTHVRSIDTARIISLSLENFLPVQSDRSREEIMFDKNGIERRIVISGPRDKYQGYFIENKTNKFEVQLKGKESFLHVMQRMKAYLLKSLNEKKNKGIILHYISHDECMKATFQIITGEKLKKDITYCSTLHYKYNKELKTFTEVILVEPDIKNKIFKKSVEWHKFKKK